MSDQPAACTAGLNGVFTKPNRPLEYLQHGLQPSRISKSPGMENKYLKLKEKIMCTDELIQKYRQKVVECEQFKQQLKEVQTKLSIEEKGRKGLVAELNILHKESEDLRRDKEMIHSEFEHLHLNVKEGELIKEQLLEQVNELKGEKEMCCEIKEELKVTKSEMDKYKRMYQKLKHEFEVYKAEQKAELLPSRRRRRRTSEATSLPMPIISPPLSEALSPLSACSLPLPLLGLPSLMNTSSSELPSVRDTQQGFPPQLEDLLRYRQDDISRCDLSAGLPMKKESENGDRQPEHVDFDALENDVSTVDSSSPKKCDGVTVDGGGNEDVRLKKSQVGIVKSMPNVKVMRLSDDSESKEEEENTTIMVTSCPLRSSPRKRTVREKRVSVTKNKTSPKTRKSLSSLDKCSQEQTLNVSKNLPSNNFSVCKDSALNRQSDKEAAADVHVHQGSGTADQQRNLTDDLFGEFDDNLSHLSVSDSSSCCSQSSLGRMDDLADLLLSSEPNIQEKDTCNGDGGEHEGGRTRNQVGPCDLTVEDRVEGMEVLLSGEKREIDEEAVVEVMYVDEPKNCFAENVRPKTSKDPLVTVAGGGDEKGRRSKKPGSMAVVNSMPDVKVIHLSDDSECEDGEGTVMTMVKPCLLRRSPRKKTALEKGALVDTNNLNPVTLKNYSFLDKSSLEQKLTLNLPSLPSDNLPLFKEDTLGGQSAAACMHQRSLTTDGQRKLTEELFGEFDDSLSHSSESDSSSCCSADDLAELLLSSEPNVKEKENGDSGEREGGRPCNQVGPCDLRMEERVEGMEVLSSGKNWEIDENAVIEAVHVDQLKKNCLVKEEAPKISKDILCSVMVPPLLSKGNNKQSLNDGTSSLTLVNIKSLPTDKQQTLNSCDISNRLSSSKSFVKEKVSDQETSSTLTSSNSLSARGLCEGPSVLLPRIQVEAAAADTASSEDSDCEMDISFSSLFGEEFQAISPLPPSPIDSRVCRVSTPLSPLPLSPSSRQLVTPLPPTPRQRLETISPLPQSPINAHRTSFSPSLPLPIQSLNSAHTDTGITLAELKSSEVVDRREAGVSPVLFDDAVPDNVRVPKPCSLSFLVNACQEKSPCSDVVGTRAAGSTATTPSPGNRKLSLSKGSPFSPLTFVLPPSSSSEAISSFEPSVMSGSADENSSALKTGHSSLQQELSSSTESATIHVFEAVPLTTFNMAKSTSLSVENDAKLPMRDLSIKKTPNGGSATPANEVKVEVEKEFCDECVNQPAILLVNDSKLKEDYGESTDSTKAGKVSVSENEAGVEDSVLDSAVALHLEDKNSLATTTCEKEKSVDESHNGSILRVKSLKEAASLSGSCGAKPTLEVRKMDGGGGDESVKVEEEIRVGEKDQVKKLKQKREEAINADIASSCGGTCKSVNKVHVVPLLSESRDRSKTSPIKEEEVCDSGAVGTSADHGNVTASTLEESGRKSTAAVSDPNERHLPCNSSHQVAGESRPTRVAPTEQSQAVKLNSTSEPTPLHQNLLSFNDTAPKPPPEYKYQLRSRNVRKSEVWQKRKRRTSSSCSSGGDESRQTTKKMRTESATVHVFEAVLLTTFNVPEPTSLSVENEPMNDFSLKNNPVKSATLTGEVKVNKEERPCDVSVNEPDNLLVNDVKSMEDLKESTGSTKVGDMYDRKLGLGDKDSLVTVVCEEDRFGDRCVSQSVVQDDSVEEAARLSDSGGTKPTLEVRKVKDGREENSAEVKEEEMVKEEQVGELEQMEEKSIDVDEELSCDSKTVKVPLLSESGDHSRTSPIEEGEICDSDKEDTSAEQVDMTSPTLEERDRGSTAAMSDLDALLPLSIGNSSHRVAEKGRLIRVPPLPPEKSQAVKSNSTSELAPLHQDLLPPVAAKHQGTVQHSRNCKSSLKAIGYAAGTTFDSLLNNFCSKTVVAQSAAKTNKVVAVTGGPPTDDAEKPTPLARLLLTSKNRRKNTRQAKNIQAATFIGLGSDRNLSVANSSHDTNRSQTGDNFCQKFDKPVHQELDKPVCQVLDGQNKTLKRLDDENSIASGVTMDTQLPASKRPKLEKDTASSIDRQLSEQTMVSGIAETTGDSSTSSSSFNATAPDSLPGYNKYQLRSKNVTKSVVWKKRERRISSSCNSGDGEKSEQPAMMTRKRSKTICSSSFVRQINKSLRQDGIVGGPSHSVEVMEGSDIKSATVEEKTASICSDQSLSRMEISEDMSTVEQNPKVATQPWQFKGNKEECPLISNNGPATGRKMHTHAETTFVHVAPILSLSDTSVSSLQPATTSAVLAESSNFGDSSDAVDSDEPLMIADLDSLLLDGKQADDDDKDKEEPSCNDSQMMEPTVCLPRGSTSTAAVIKSKPHVRKTDSATGQEEDQTPASSPKPTGVDIVGSKQLPLSSSEQENVAMGASNVTNQQKFPISSSTFPPPPSPRSTIGVHTPHQSLLASHGAGATAVVGYGQPQQTPLPVYATHCSGSTSRLKPGPKSSSGQGGRPSSSSLFDDDDDDVFHAPLPLLEKATATTTAKEETTHHPCPARVGVADRGQSSAISLAQQELTVCMQSPLALPQWLVAAMTRVQSKHEHCAASGMGLTKKKRGNAKEPIVRQGKQKVKDYIMVNLERLVCGHLYLSTALTMFTNQQNVPQLADFVSATVEFLWMRYNPKIEHVASVFHSLCNDVRGNPSMMDPYDGGFPPALLRPECQLVALFAQMSQLSPIMAALLPEMNKAFYEALVFKPLKFHKLCAFARILTAICRLQGDSDRVLFLGFDLLKKPITVNELPVIAALASVWPKPLARKPGVRLVDAQSAVVLKGLEQQLLSYTLEVLTMAMMQGNEAKVHAKLTANLFTLCHWREGYDIRITALTTSLLKLLNSSDDVYIVSPPKEAGVLGSTPWHRPRPSVLAFHIVHCLRMISNFQGWVWTNDILIRAHLWPLLQQWNAKRDSVREATVVCTVRLIGFISQQGLSHDVDSSSIGQLQRVFIALLYRSDQISLPVQLAAVDSILELCPPSHPRTKEIMGVVGVWLKQQSEKPHGKFLLQEFYPRLQAFNVK